MFPPHICQHLQPRLLIKSVYIAITFLLAGRVDLARSQGCCTVGASSLGGIESGIQRHNHLRIGLNYQYNSVTRAYNESMRIDDPQRRAASVSYFSLHAEYGLHPDVSLFVAIPFSDKTREITVNNAITLFDETAKFNASGFGDIVVLAKYSIVSPTLLSPFELALGGGASLPTGSVTKQQNNNQLSIDLQPGTGAPALIAWGFVMRSFLASSTRLFGTVSYRYSGANFDGYRIGDEFVVGAGGEYSFDEHFGLAVWLRSRFARQDYANRRILNATGGTYHDVMPSVSYFDGPSQLRVFAQLPIYRNVRGIQLTLAYLLGVEFNHTIDFGK